MSEEDLIRAGELGDRVKAFIESEIGEMLIDKSERDESEAMRALLTIEPYKYTTLGELQSAIAQKQENVILAGKVHSYLAEAVIQGQEADQLLMNEES